MLAERGTGFLNVDLDIVADEDLSALVAAFEPAAFALHSEFTQDRFQASLELSSELPDPDSVIAEYVNLVENLDPSSRLLWDSAERRDFNIGIQAGTEPHAAQYHVSPQTLEGAARVKARVVITVYGAK